MNDEKTILSLNITQLKIQAASMTVASLFHESYSDSTDSDQTINLLEAFRALRRSLPKDESGRHVGHSLTTALMQG